MKRAIHANGVRVSWQEGAPPVTQWLACEAERWLREQKGVEARAVIEPPGAATEPEAGADDSGDPGRLPRRLQP